VNLSRRRKKSAEPSWCGCSLRETSAQEYPRKRFGKCAAKAAFDGGCHYQEEDAVAGREYEPGEITARGEAIYRELIGSQIGPVEKGTFVVIDVDSGDYEIDARDATATRRLLKRKPAAVTYGVRVGHRAAYSHVSGFRMPRHDD
jgi:hypothetical protein